MPSFPFPQLILLFPLQYVLLVVNDFFCRKLLQLQIRSTSTYFYNNQFFPLIGNNHHDELHMDSKSSVMGNKKCFIISVKGNYSWISSKDLYHRVPLGTHLSFDQYFFECNDFTKTTRNCQNMTCMIRGVNDGTYKLAVILYLPPCASYIYYLEWNGNTVCGVPDFVLFTDDTDAKKLLKSFSFRQIQFTKKTEIIFVQQVFGPSSFMQFLCHYNHFDTCLELLPDGPSQLVPSNVWKSISLSKLIANARTHNRSVAYHVMTTNHQLRCMKLQKLPSIDDIFEPVRKKKASTINYRFQTGKKVRDDLPLTHVCVSTCSDKLTVSHLDHLFAIPLLGSKVGTFANVDYETIINIHTKLHNGMPIQKHNNVVETLASSLVHYHVYDFGTSPIMVTINTDCDAEHNVHEHITTYGHVLSDCYINPRAMICFIFYCTYCNPIILTSKHKAYLQSAVGNGSGSRHCCSIPPGVTNFYFGLRSYPTLAQSSPVVGPKMTSHHDNYRKHWNSTMLASFVPISNTLSVQQFTTSQGGLIRYWNMLVAMDPNSLVNLTKIGSCVVQP